jgi:hypothetical protein
MTSQKHFGELFGQPPWTTKLNSSSILAENSIEVAAPLAWLFTPDVV